jgi:hypothetical protein
VLVGMVLPLLWVVVVVNLQFVGAVLPWLLRLMLGVETVLSRTQWESSATWLGFSGAIGFLLVDPLSKAVFALRGFRCDARSSGADLLAALRRITTARSATTTAVLLAGLLAIGSPSPCPAQAEPAAGEQRQMEEALEEVFRQRKYGWRIPPEADDKRTFMDDVNEWLKEKERDFQKWWDEFWEDEQERQTRPDLPEVNGSAKRTGEWVTGLLKILTYVLATLAVAGAIVFAIKSVRRQETVEQEESETADAVDVSDESVRADALAEDEWLAMAERLAGEGKLRLAMRAVFLAELAYLARQELIVLTRYKSNREYHRELLRRGRHLTDVQDALDGSIRIFERSWYGHHEVTREMLDEMRNRCREVHTA